MVLAYPMKCVPVFATELLKALIYGVLPQIPLGELCNGTPTAFLKSGKF